MTRGSVRKWAKRIAIALFGLIVAGYLAVLITFQVAKRGYVAAYERGSEVADTAVGPFEYALVGHGPVVLFSHGTPGGYDQGLMLCDRLNDAGFSLLSISRPGFGRTPLTAGETPAEQADAMVALLDSQGIDRVAAVGSSGGGPPIVELAIRHPDRLWAHGHASSLFEPLEGIHAPMEGGMESVTSALFGDGFMQWAMIHFLKRRLPAMVADPEIAQYFPAGYASIIGDEAKFAQLVEMLWSGTGFTPAMRDAGWENDRRQYADLAFSADIGSISVPTFVVHGVADKNTVFEAAERFAAQVPDAELDGIPDAGHFAMLDIPDRYWSGLIAFLKRHAPQQ